MLAPENCFDIEPGLARYVHKVNAKTICGGWRSLLRTDGTGKLHTGWISVLSPDWPDQREDIFQ
jgi:hypothetical protein